MTEVGRAGKQLQKIAPEQKQYFQKPNDRPRYTHQKRLKKPYLGYKRVTFSQEYHTRKTARRTTNNTGEPA